MTPITHITIGGNRYEISRYYETPFNQLRLEVGLEGASRIPMVSSALLEGPEITLERKVKLPFQLVRDKQSLISVIELETTDPETLEFPKQDFPNNFTGHH